MEAARVRLTVPTARRLAIWSQLMGSRRQVGRGKAGAAQVIDHLGRVQIDTISVVERAHHHILWSRCPSYDPQMLHELQARERRVFEYWWGHTASYLPMSDYRYYRSQMEAAAAAPWMQQWLSSHRELADTVLGRIRDEGPLASADFADTSGRKRGSWWDWKPAKHALEMLLRAGILMVAGRRSFQRLYDLAERVLPPGTSTRGPSKEETARFVVRRALTAMGSAPLDGIRWSWLGDRRAISEAVAEMAATGEVTPVQMQGRDGETQYAWTELLNHSGRPGRARLHLLSPFDPLVADRRRTRELFGFDCKLESYVPAAKREHGYFCLPILCGDHFIGRLDPKADRKSKSLVVRKLTLEQDGADVDQILPLLAAMLRAFATFNRCESVVLEVTEPRRLRTPLSMALKTL